MKRAMLTAAVLFLTMAGLVRGEAPDSPAQRSRADQAVKDGNFKDAFEIYQKLALDPADAPELVSHDLMRGIACLVRIDRADEVDTFRDDVITVHEKNWRLLQTAAQTLLAGDNSGFLVGGKFHRGNRRANDGRSVDSGPRDRARALQLMVEAMPLAVVDADKTAAGELFLNLAGMLLHGRAGDDAWKLQSLTDLKNAAEFPASGREPFWLSDNERVGTPVNEDGSPVSYTIPATWETAQSDGQRWRWCLHKAVEVSPALTDRATFTLAEFLAGGLDVSTINRDSRNGNGTGSFSAEQLNQLGASPQAIGALKDDETIAFLATGIKRLQLPDEFNFIKLLDTVVAGNDKTYAEQALNSLANIYTSRRQYDRAAAYWKQSIDRFGPGDTGVKQEALDQILGNWVAFSGNDKHIADREVIETISFRNGKHVRFEAREVDLPKVLEDINASATGGRRHVGPPLFFGGIGRWVARDTARFTGDKIAEWEMDVQPAATHMDTEAQVIVPIKKAGTYLITAKADNGNTTRKLLTITDTVIVHKMVERGVMFYIADASTGNPVPGAKVNLFGYRTYPGRPSDMPAPPIALSANTDAKGMATIPLEVEQPDPNGPRVPFGDEREWVVTSSAPDHHFTYQFSQRSEGFLSREYKDGPESTAAAFVITDRPVYRPGQTVKFKGWIAEPRFDLAGGGLASKQTFTVTVQGPRGETLLERAMMTDAFGGLDGELALPVDAPLGDYRCQIDDFPAQSFTVEEYKKPEFEVTVEAPQVQVELGAVITATVHAKYYFGQPVASAKVKYRVERRANPENFFPAERWDWLYDEGYSRLNPQYTWWPAWKQWGHPQAGSIVDPAGDSTIILNNEATLDANGTLKIAIETASAKSQFGARDFTYFITAEITDSSRRAIIGEGRVTAAGAPYRVWAWVDRGYYSTGDTVEASFEARTAERKPVKGKGVLKLLKISFPGDSPGETTVESWNLDTSDAGVARLAIKAAGAGQYRLSYTVADEHGHSIEGGYVFVIRGQTFDKRSFRFNDLEVIPDQRQYKPGDVVHLMINSSHEDATVLLFIRPSSIVYLPPRLVHIHGKSTIEEIVVSTSDMPNFFVDAVTVHDGEVFQEGCQIIVPPESRVLNVEVISDKSRYKPDDKATVKLRLTDLAGRPVAGSAVITIYDKSLEYIASWNIEEMKSRFWGWKRQHWDLSSSPDFPMDASFFPQDTQMFELGEIGKDLVEEAARKANGIGLEVLPEDAAVFGDNPGDGRSGSGSQGLFGASGGRMVAAVPSQNSVPLSGRNALEPTVRKNFADSALWIASVVTDKNGEVQVDAPLPQNLTTWKVKVWTMSPGVRVGEGSAEFVTYKNLIVRLQAPRFFVQKDEVVISANIHNYLPGAKQVTAGLAVEELDGAAVSSLDAKVERVGNGWELTSPVTIEPGGEKRVDWRIRIDQPGQIKLRVKALSDEESDATEMVFPVYVHGMLKTESFAGVMRPEEKSATLSFNVPAERRPEQSRLEIRYSPSVAAAMLDALPYLLDYPYGCTEQTLNRFLPTVLTQRTLTAMKLDLKQIQQKRLNLNAQEIGDPARRAADWERNNPPNPGINSREAVFDEEVVAKMAAAGLERLRDMENPDGGWGWFGGGDFSFPDITAMVVHGLQVAVEKPVDPDMMLTKGIEWLHQYQVEQLRLVHNFAAIRRDSKQFADDADALVFMTLVDGHTEGADMDEMREILFRDRTHVGVYGKAMLGIAFQKLNDAPKLAAIQRNLAQYVVRDEENQTAYLKMPAETPWWRWYGSDTEAMATYLKLLCLTDPKGQTASRLAKYLINNRKHASYWNSTRDTAMCIEALANYVKSSGEARPDLTVGISLDGRKIKDVRITADNLMSFDAGVILSGKDLTTGTHRLQFDKQGAGPLYFNAYLTYFTLEDPIVKTGLEVRVERKYYKLTPASQRVPTAGPRGQVIEQQAIKYDRQQLPDLAAVKSGDLVEVELSINSKNDYEYILIEDMKPAGFEPAELRSGFDGNDLGAYVEFRDNRVCFFCRTLARGEHSVSYRLRAETPGKFSALPTRVSAMYAPELRANSDEGKVRVED